MKFVFPVFIALLLFASIHGQAQVNKAAEFLSKGNFSEAVLLYEKAREKGVADYSDLTNLAYCYIMLHDMPSAAKIFEVIIMDSNVEPVEHFYYGEVLRIMGNFDAAKIQYGIYSTKVPSDFRAKQRIASCDSLPYWKSHPTDHQVSNAGDINSAGEEMYPWINHDKLYFTSNSRDLLTKAGRSCSYSDPLISFAFCKSANSFTSPIPVHWDSLSYQMCSIRDNIGLLVTKTIRKTSNSEILGSSVIKMSNPEGAWSDFRLKEIPEGFIMSQPCLSSSDTRMFFVSDMPGGSGGTDLYYSDNVNGIWSAPVNLGKDINSIGNEMFPFITANDSCLYFSSDGLPGFGNMDIFRSVWVNGKWSTPVNMRSPINSIGNDFSMVFGDNPRSGYLVSNRSASSKGGHDIYSFNLPVTQILVPETIAPRDTFIAKSTDLRCVFFATGQFRIEDNYKHMLDSIAALMQKYSFLKVNITAFTDSRGPEGINANLQNERAKVIGDWFISKSITPNRIVSKAGGISTNNNLDLLTYHVQIGFLSNNNGVAYYEWLLKNAFPVNVLAHKNGFSYMVGSGTQSEMRSMAAQIKAKYGIETMIVATYNGVRMEDIYYAPNRRTEIFLSNH